MFAKTFVRIAGSGPRRLLVSAIFLIAVCTGSTLAQAPAAANPCAPQLTRPQDQLWLVSARGLGCAPYGATVESLRYWHYLPQVGWQAATAADFFASDDPAAITQFWIHGNRIDSNDTFQVGWTVYTSLARRAISPQPLRFVIWSWPSEQAGRLLQDMREKAARTMPASFPLARVISAIKPDVAVNIIGYSYGARIALGACQLLAGGALGGRSIPADSAGPRVPINLVLIAAAVDAGGLMPGCQFGKSLSVAGRLLLVNNSCDQALRFYRFLYGRRSCVEALGYVGLGYASRLGANGAKISQFDACCLVGSEHYWANYFASPAVVGRIESIVFGSPPVVTAPSAARGNLPAGRSPSDEREFAQLTSLVAAGI